MKTKFNKKLLAICTTVGAVTTQVTTTCFAAGEGALPEGVNDFFSSLSTGLIATIAAISVIALGVYAAPQAIVFAKKIFKKVSG